MSDYQPTNGTKWRLDNLTERMRDLESKNETVSVLRVEVNGLKEGMGELRAEVSTLRKALYTAALSVAGGALVFAFTVFQVIGH
jgi:hypothetical protein